MYQIHNIFSWCYYVRGRHIPHKSPLGYKRDGKILVPDLATKDVIVRIFNLYYEGNSYQTIANIFKKDFWSDKDDKFKKKMTEVFKEQILDLEEVVPNFKIANATIHYDESSPHLHIVGVPFKDGMKNGMEKQVGKSDVFNKISLTDIQDKMREYCINSFNRIYHLNYTLKAKEDGRNVDINVANMNEYKKFKREQEKYKKQLKELNNKTDE